MNRLLALTQISPSGLPQPGAGDGAVANVLSVVFGLVGALALLMIVISGLRYVIAGSDPQRTAKAKEGIVYALVGLSLALAAEAIVGFVVGRL